MARRLRADGTTGQDETISERHKFKWGTHVPCADFDFPVFEFGYGKAVALIEYKHTNVDVADLKKKRLLAFFTVNPELPTLVVVYDDAQEPWTIWIIKANKLAKDSLASHFGPLETRIAVWKDGVRGVKLTEAEYVAWMWKLRQMVCPQHILDSLTPTTDPGEEEGDTSIYNW